MIQKVLKVGSSAAVTIPKKTLEELGWKVGDQVVVEIDKRKRVVLIRPSIKLSRQDKKIAKLTFDFIHRYRHDLETLARK